MLGPGRVSGARETTNTYAMVLRAVRPKEKVGKPGG